MSVLNLWGSTREELCCKSNRWMTKSQIEAIWLIIEVQFTQIGLREIISYNGRSN